MFEHQRKKTLSKKMIKDLTAMSSSVQFLADSKRQLLLQKMQEYSDLETTRYHSVCVALVVNLVNYSQHLPESSNSYYAQPGGLVDYALNRTEAALSLFKEFIILNSTESLSEEQKLWQYALYSAALLQGIGKLFVDYHVNLFDANGHSLKPWNPLAESLVSTGDYYDYEFKKESDVEFRRRLNILIAKALMPASGFNWIASNTEVLAVWLALLNEDKRSAGTLGAILIRADAIAIQRYFANFLVRAEAGRSGRTQARTGTFSGGVPESIMDKKQIIGVQFIQWLIRSLGEGIIMINKAPLLMVPGGLLMCPEIFRLFVREHPEYKNWQAIQKSFLTLGLHRRSADGTVFSRYEQVHNQQMHTGVVFSEYAVALPSSVRVHYFASGKEEVISATQLIYHTQENNHFIPDTPVKAEALQKLTSNGQWEKIEQELPSFNLGIKHCV